MMRKYIFFLVIAGSVTMLAQSCNSIKKGCGCGNDINKNYRASSRRG